MMFKKLIIVIFSVYRLFVIIVIIGLYNSFNFLILLIVNFGWLWLTLEYFPFIDQVTAPILLLIVKDIHFFH